MNISGRRLGRTPRLFGAAIAFALAACSGEPDEASLRPPAEWRASVAQTARNTTDQARAASEAALRRSPAVTGPALVQAIRFSRIQAMAAQTPQPMPDKIRTALSAYFDDEILDSARWTTAGQDLGLGSLLARWYYEEGAVTLKDLIVFSDAEVAENVWLWAHELAHMEQYRRLGTEGFAARYVSDWRALESEANRRAFAITADIRARRTIPRTSRSQLKRGSGCWSHPASRRTRLLTRFRRPRRPHPTADQKARLARALRIAKLGANSRRG